MKNFTYRIYYEDTDAGGVVYYANYLKFFERARTDFLRSCGISQAELKEKENLVFVVKKCQIEYFAPAKLDDLIEVSVEVLEISGATVRMKQEMNLSGKLLNLLEVVIVCIDSENFKPKRINEELITTLRKW